MTAPLTIVGLGGSLNARSASLAALETSLEAVGAARRLRATHGDTVLSKSA